MDPEPSTPSPLSSSPSTTPQPRLRMPSDMANAADQPPTSLPPSATPQGDQSVGATPVNERLEADRSAAAPAPAPRVFEPMPGDIVLPARVRLSLSRLFKLEEELAQFLGPDNVVVDVLEDGRTVVRVPAELEQRARDYLALSGELNESEDSRG